MHDHIDPARLEAGRIVQVFIYGGTSSRTGKVLSVERVPRHFLTSYTLHVFTIEWEDGSMLEINNQQAIFATPEYQQFEWCTTCRRRTEVEEKSWEEHYSGPDAYERLVTRFVCGHTSEGEAIWTGVSPGGEAAQEAMAGAERQRIQERRNRAEGLE